MFKIQKKLLIALFSLFSFGGMTVFAGEGDLSEAEKREVNNYELTEKKLTQFSQATKNLIAALQKNPELAKTRNAEELTNKQGLAGLEEAFTKIPEAKKAVEDAGLTAREYWVFQMAMVYAGAGHMAVKAGGQIPAGFSKSNIDFFRTHEPQFMALDKDLKQFQELSDPDSAGSDDAEDIEDEDEENDEDDEEESFQDWLRPETK